MTLSGRIIIIFGKKNVQRFWYLSKNLSKETIVQKQKVQNFNRMPAFYLLCNSTLADNFWAPWVKTKLYVVFEISDVWYASAAQWQCCIFTLFYNNLNLTLLLHKEVLVNFLIGTTVHLSESKNWENWYSYTLRLG